MVDRLALVKLDENTQFVVRITGTSGEDVDCCPLVRSSGEWRFADADLVRRVPLALVSFPYALQNVVVGAGLSLGMQRCAGTCRVCRHYIDIGTAGGVAVGRCRMYTWKSFGRGDWLASTYWPGGRLCAICEEVLVLADHASASEGAVAQ